MDLAHGPTSCSHAGLVLLVWAQVGSILRAPGCSMNNSYWHEVKVRGRDRDCMGDEVGKGLQGEMAQCRGSRGCRGQTASAAMALTFGRGCSPRHSSCLTTTTTNALDCKIRGIFLHVKWAGWGELVLGLSRYDTSQSPQLLNFHKIKSHHCPFYLFPYVDKRAEIPN